MDKIIAKWVKKSEMRSENTIKVLQFWPTLLKQMKKMVREREISQFLGKVVYKLLFRATNKKLQMFLYHNLGLIWETVITEWWMIWCDKLLSRCNLLLMILIFPKIMQLLKASKHRKHKTKSDTFSTFWNNFWIK